jgi:retron-type reverse transcriptase
MEQVVERENMLQALRRVQQNKGAPGVDGMDVKLLTPFLKEHWQVIREELLDDAYKPKPDGGVRLLGIPTVLDRLIQQALL